MTDHDPIERDVPRIHLSSEEKATRSGSFGGIASQYQHYRPGPPVAAVDWILPHHVGTIVDLGAGTGALTRLLVGRADEVIAVEPDDRMRSILTEEVPGVRAITGRGESVPLPDSSADAVLASSSWHWMDPTATLDEMGRVLAPDGILAALWSGPDPEGPFLVQAQGLLAEQSQGGAEAPAGNGRDDRAVADLIMGQADRPPMSLEIPPGVPFEQPQHEVFTWDIALNAEDLIGLLQTFSWIITLNDERRARVIAEARRLLREVLRLEGEATVDVAFRADVWRTHHTG